MKVEELRIGNLVYLCDEVHTIDYKDIDELYHDPIDDAYKPIEITNDWLIKFGFINSFNEGMLIKGLGSIDKHIEMNGGNYGFYPTLHCAAEMSHEDPQLFDLNKIDYIHELQNLYFILTNTELVYE